MSQQTGLPNILLVFISLLSISTSNLQITLFVLVSVEINMVVCFFLCCQIFRLYEYLICFDDVIPIEYHTMHYFKNPRHTQPMIAYDFDWVWAFLEIPMKNCIVGTLLTCPIYIDFFSQFFFSLASNSWFQYFNSQLDLGVFWPSYSGFIGFICSRGFSCNKMSQPHAWTAFSISLNTAYVKILNFMWTISNFPTSINFYQKVLMVVWRIYYISQYRWG